MTDKPKDPEGILLYGIEELVQIVDSELSAFETLIQSKHNTEAYLQGIGAHDLAARVNEKLIAVLLEYNTAAKKRLAK